MKNKPFLKYLLFFLFFHFEISFLSAQDTLLVTKTDTLSVSEIEPTNFGDSFLNQTLQLFTSEPKVDSSELENVITKDFSDYLKIFRQLEILSYGPVSQAKYLRFLGIPSERVGIFYDDNNFNLQSLYIPQSGDVELQILPLENIQSVQLINNGLANLIEPGGYSAGLFLKQKEYISGEPFSKLQFDQGIKGFRRAQVELGRPLFQNRLRFYLTAGFKKYAGDADNTDQDLDNFSGKFTYDLNSNSKMVLNGYYYEGKRGVRGFPGWEVLGIRKNDKISNWSLDYYREILQDKTFKLKLGYNYAFQNLKPMDWDLKNQTFVSKVEVYPNSSDKFNWKIGADFKYDRMKEYETYTRWRGNFNIGTLWQIAPNLNHLAWVNFVKTQTFKPDVTAITGLSWRLEPKWRIFVLGSRNIFHPTLFDLDFTKHEWPGYITLTGNPNLLPTKSHSLNGGISHTIAGLELGAFIHYEKSNSPGYNPLSVEGLNLFVIQNTLANFKFYFKINLQSKGPYKKYGLDLSSGYLLIAYKHSFVNNLLQLTIISENEFVDNPNLSNSLTRYFISNGKIGIRIKDFFIFYALENITNQTYRTFGDFNMPKRNYFWGVSWEFRD
ncbi:MAG: hypothetical protein A2145_06430 [candidate division Zixibacteria bacterium RBG_16_40_9]|nr:MAG: hypothetical protein A2145_06430 [candidate division Zixibacteria bacterium RBG_16_40_9]